MALDKDFFVTPYSSSHRQYEALRAYYVEGLPASVVAERFGYSYAGFRVMLHKINKKIKSDTEEFEQYFFNQKRVGRKPKPEKNQTDELIIQLRKKYLSVPDIKAILDTLEYSVCETYIYKVLKSNGFARLPRRNQEVKTEVLSNASLKAPESVKLDFVPESFTATNLGLLCLIPYLERYKIDQILSNSTYPETNAIDRTSSLLSFIALKLCNVKRYSRDDIWCMDRGLGLFAGLNVLPKATWFSSYSHRVTRNMNLDLLRKVHGVWLEHNLLCDTANLDFTTLPYWGDDSHLENNWSGTRHKSMPSILAVLAQDPDTGIITYSDTNIRHENKNQVVLEFLDFYAEQSDINLRYLVFDSKFTTYENLGQLNQKGIKFLTIRRRGKNIIDQLNQLPLSDWRKVRVPDSTGKGRVLSVNDQRINLRDYGGELRQVAISGHGRIKPALIITNDFDLTCSEIIRKYARRWLVEKDISQQIEFFHFNRISSSMVIKVDFDLTMSILANNLLRLFATDLQGGYSRLNPESLYTKFLQNSGRVNISNSHIEIMLRKKRNLPAILSATQKFREKPSRIFEGRRLIISGDSRS